MKKIKCPYCKSTEIMQLAKTVINKKCENCGKCFGVRNEERSYKRNKTK